MNYGDIKNAIRELAEEAEGNGNSWDDWCIPRVKIIECAIDRLIAAESKPGDEKELVKELHFSALECDRLHVSNDERAAEIRGLKSKLAELDYKQPLKIYAMLGNGIRFDFKDVDGFFAEGVDGVLSATEFLYAQPKPAEAVQIPETVKMFLDSIIDFCLDEDYLTEPASYVKTWLANKYLPNDTKPKESVDQRITERDIVLALDNMIKTWDDIYPDMESGKYPQERLEHAEFNEVNKLRDLLAKLNEHRELDEKLNDGVAPYVYFKKIKGKDEWSSWNEFSDGSSGGKPLFEKQVTANKAEVPEKVSDAMFFQMAKVNIKCGYNGMDEPTFTGVDRDEAQRLWSSALRALPPLKDGAQ